MVGSVQKIIDLEEPVADLLGDSLNPVTENKEHENED